MKTHIAVLVGIISVMSPGLAFANLLNAGVGVNGNVESNLELEVEERDREANEVSATAKLGIGASTSASAREDARDDRATSSRGNSDEAGDTAPNATSSEHRKDGENASGEDGRGFGKGGLVGFFRWIFGLPDDTTVGEIRTELQATTTLSTSSGQAVSTDSSSQGLGFWARIFGFLSLGN